MNITSSEIIKNGKFILGILFLFISAVHAQKRQQISLNEHWIVRSLEVNEPLPENIPSDFKNPGEGWYAGQMPKQVQEFILENGELPDPHVNNNAAKWVSVFRKYWVYCKRFITPENSGNIALCFSGLDTEVDIILNGQKVAYCNNMHRRWVIPVANKLNAEGEENILVLRFHPPQSVIDSFVARYPDHNVNPRVYLRKPAVDFSSYLGARPNFLKMGVFDDVFLDILPVAYFGDVYVRSRLSGFSMAEVSVNPEIQNGGRPEAESDSELQIVCELLSPSGRLLSLETLEDTGPFTIPVEQPRLWWPMEYGDQPLYTIRLMLHNGKDNLDKKEISFGIRDIKMELKDEKTGEPRFGFRINGKMIFMHGANWAPLEGFTHVWDKERADRLLDIMKTGHFNFLRIWGEGSIPGTSLFDKCDKDGIVVWMEFMTSAPLQHPIHDPGFNENIRAEVEDEIRRLRNHPSIAIWCGGNEHYLNFKSNDGDNSQPVERELFQKTMPELVHELDPHRYFHPSSPWGGDNWPTGNYPLEGDFHDYSTYRFQPRATVPLFTTEVCMVSPYSLHNMKRFMSDMAIWPEGFRFVFDEPGKHVWPQGWEDHSIPSAWEKIGRIQDFCDIQNAKDACRVFGTAHGEYLRDRYETQRRGVPKGREEGCRRSWGAAVWRLNDAWPMIYMSVIDYYLEPKIPFYFMKRACEPVLVSFEQTDERVCVWIVNDSPAPVEDSLFVELWTFDGQMKKRTGRKVSVPSTKSERLMDLTFEFHEIRKRNEFLVARLGDKVITHLLWPERYLQLTQGNIEAMVEGKRITLTSDCFIKDVELLLPGTSGAVFSDNYFNLIPGEPKHVKIIESLGGKTLEIKGLNSKTVRFVLN